MSATVHKAHLVYEMMAGDNLQESAALVHKISRENPGQRIYLLFNDHIIRCDNATFAVDIVERYDLEVRKSRRLAKEVF